MEEIATPKPVTQTPVQAPSESPKKKFLNKKMLFLGLTLLILISVAGTLSNIYLLNSNKQVACTLEAKLCPDGSSVGRTGPKCEFTKCPEITPTPPTVSLNTSDWKTYVNTENGISFKYPDNWDIKKFQDATLMLLLESHPFEIPAAGEFLTSIEVTYNEAQNTQTNQKFFMEKTLSEGKKRIEDLFDPKTLKTKNLTIGGKDAVQISGEGLGMLGGYHEWTLIQMNNKLLTIELHNKNYEEIYQELLSTFKFTDQATLTPTCIPRPACLDSTPRCMIAESDNMCPPTITPNP